MTRLRRRTHSLTHTPQDQNEPTKQFPALRQEVVPLAVLPQRMKRINHLIAVLPADGVCTVTESLVQSHENLFRVTISNLQEMKL